MGLFGFLSPFIGLLGNKARKKERINGCFSVWEEPNSSMPDLSYNVLCTWERGREMWGDATCRF